jgi:hypothetical protein
VGRFNIVRAILPVHSYNRLFAWIASRTQNARWLFSLSMNSWLVGVIAAIVYFIARSTTDYVWDDTRELYLVRPDAVRHLPGLVDLLRSLSPTSNYRPLASYVAAHGLAFVGGGAVDVRIWLAAMAIVVGCTAAAVNALARRMLSGGVWSTVATILFICSPAFLTGSWVVLAGQQPVVSLLMCLGVLCYLWQNETQGRWRAMALLGLCLVLLLGPWYREFLLMVAVLIVTEEVRCHRRPTMVMGIGALGCLHGLFPMLLPKLLIDRSLPLIATPFLGYVGSQLGRPASTTQGLHLLADFTNLRFEVSPQLLALFPPSLVALGWLGFMLSGVRNFVMFSQREPVPGRKEMKLLRTLRSDRMVAATAGLAVVAVITVPTLLRIHPTLSRSTIPIALASILIAAALIFYGFSVSPLLSVWMALALAPLYWVYTEIVHLAYPLIPASIVVAGGLRECWLALRRLNGRQAVALRYAFSLMITVLLLDQVLNVYNVWYVVKQCNNGMRIVASRLQRHVPRGSVIIGNVIHLYDIDHYAGNWFVPYLTVRAGTRGPYADSRASVASVLLQHRGTTYLLDVRQPYLPDQYAYHSHPLVRSHAVDWADLGSLYETRAVYPFVDPAQALVPRAFVPFPGAPDLVQDFYRGRALDRGPFLREVYAEYHLYRVTGTIVRPW